MCAFATRMLTAFLFLTAVLFGADYPLAGTWRLNIAKSKLTPSRPMLQSLTSRIEVKGDDIRQTDTIVTADGRTIKRSYLAKLDGKDYPLIGWEGVDSVSIKHINTNTWADIMKKDGKLVLTGQRVLSKDGKVMTFTSTGTNIKGEKVLSIGVYDRQ